MGNASALPYAVGEAVEVGGDDESRSAWTMHAGTKKANKEPVSIFRFSKEEAEASSLEAAKNAFLRHKVLRHPRILACVEAIEEEKELLVATEPVVPLRRWLAEFEGAARGQTAGGGDEAGAGENKTAAVDIEDGSGGGGGGGGGGGPALSQETVDAQKRAAIVWGLRCVGEAISFINNDCGLVHGALCMDAVFVTASGDWKLGALDLTVRVW
jgi:SCY1-like protein 1